MRRVPEATPVPTHAPHDEAHRRTSPSDGSLRNVPHDAGPMDDDPLGREQAHLAESRSALRAMRADVEALDLTDVTGNWVNAEVLQREMTARIAALADLADTPLFFGRLDYLHTPGLEQVQQAGAGQV